MTLDITTLFLALGVICGAIVAVLQARMTAQYAALAARQRAQERVVRLTANMLIAWARHGEWPPACQAALLEAIREYEAEQPQILDRPLHLGMDFGLGLLLERFARRAR